ncbi:hypothetical protein J4Q44_G00098730 [Coregonus suidteri]|uniref:Protein FAM217B n=1 Tax=Coregonus suidteri TaxID=861788 RepID=A0AAN8M065_9TELE
MGTVVQQCAATGLNKLLSRVEREWAKSSWTDGHVTSTRMMSQKKPLHPQMITPNLDNTHIPTSSAEKKQQRRQKHKPNIPSVKHNTNTSELSPQGQMDPPSLPFSLLSAVDGKGKRERREQQQEAQVIFPSDFQPDLPGPRGDAPGRFSYPDFLPPPFNSWSLRQLAVFFHPEGRAPPLSRPAGMVLDRYLERLLLLEWLRIQTVQEESGRVSSAPTSRCCSHHGAPSLHGRLSSPKCILQCQRAFPLTLLSSLSHPSSAPLSVCGCTHCHARYPPCTGACRSHTQNSHTSPRLPLLASLSDHRGRVSLPKRSYSESRVHSAEKASGRQRCGSPEMGIGHLKRMQAFGNIRNPVASHQQAKGIDCCQAPQTGQGEEEKWI